MHIDLPGCNFLATLGLNISSKAPHIKAAKCSFTHNDTQYYCNKKPSVHCHDGKHQKVADEAVETFNEAATDVDFDGEAR